jgi:hypothetical protein
MYKEIDCYNASCSGTMEEMDGGLVCKLCWFEMEDQLPLTVFGGKR